MTAASALTGPGGVARPDGDAPDDAAEDRVHPAAALTAALRVYLDHLAVERGVARNTLLSYRRDLERYLQFLARAGRTDVHQVTAADVSEFLAAPRSTARWSR